MILPIYTYGHSVLRTPADPVEGDSDKLQALIDDMDETMRAASGIGLAAPQIGRTKRLFVVNLDPIREERSEDAGTALKVPDEMSTLVVINPEILEESQSTESMEEGCLSIPGVAERVKRPEAIRVRFLDRSLEVQEMALEGMLARVFQHELDHLEGVLFVDKIGSLRRRLIKRDLREISKGNVEADYKLADGAEVEAE